MSSKIPLISTGSILIYAGSTSPNEYYLLCDGRQLSTNLYPNLFSLIGYTYGGSDISFNLPDLRIRFPIMYNSFQLGYKSGSNSITIVEDLPSHTHATGNINLDAHTHGVQSSFPSPNGVYSTYFPDDTENSPNGGPIGGYIFQNANTQGPYNAQTVTFTDGSLNGGSTIGANNYNNSSQDSVPIQNSYF